MARLHYSLTTEPLGEKFTNSFELVNYAIKLAKDLIITGRDCRVSTQVKNPAYWALLEISENKDTLSEITPMAPTEEERETKEALVRRVKENTE